MSATARPFFTMKNLTIGYCKRCGWTNTGKIVYEKEPGKIKIWKSSCRKCGYSVELKRK